MKIKFFWHFFEKRAKKCQKRQNWPFWHFFENSKKFIFDSYLQGNIFVSDFYTQTKAHQILRISYIWHFELGGRLHLQFYKKMIFWKIEKIRLELRDPKKLNFSKQKNSNFLNLFKVPEHVFEQDWTLYGEIKFFHFLKKKSKILAVKKFILAWAR